ncbi:hypothetical protein [Nocardia crassostreae]|uniref:hypothetical protein n=1 Tax=Nocardia crassostreae TaxID=53428 RepID=UPI000A451C82|nr:hypothetical protein [Nocardia crassostreae]
MTIQKQATGRGARRVQAAERVKSGAAQRAYAWRRSREQGRVELPPMLRRTGEPMPRGRMSFVATIIALLGCGLALTLLLTTRATEDSYQLGDARRVNRQLADERAALARDVEAADSAPELAARAAELGMIPAKDPARLVVGPDGQAIVVGDPKPAQGPPVPPLNTTPAAPSALPPALAQAQGERLVPVTTTPPTTPNAPATTAPNPAQAPQNLAQVPQPPAQAPQLAQDPQNPAQPGAQNPQPPAPQPPAPQAPAVQAAPDGAAR